MALSDFWNRIRSLYRRIERPSKPVGPPAYTLPREPKPPVVPQPTEPPVGPLDIATKVSIIVQAGKNLRLLDITYDGSRRLVEPYSFRDRWTGKLFYGWCSIHNRIHSFKPEKIEAISMTDIPFSPRWDVEL